MEKWPAEEFTCQKNPPKKKKKFGLVSEKKKYFKKAKKSKQSRPCDHGDDQGRVLPWQGDVCVLVQAQLSTPEAEILRCLNERSSRLHPKPETQNQAC